MNGFISAYTKLVKLGDHTAAGTSAVNSTGVDMTQNGGYRGALFFTSFGTAASGNKVNLAQGDTLGGSYDDLEGTSVSSGASDEDVWIDVWNPTNKFVRLEAVRGTSSTLESIWCQLYGARSLEVDNTTSGTITGETHDRPAEGTA